MKTDCVCMREQREREGKKMTNDGPNTEIQKHNIQIGDAQKRVLTTKHTLSTVDKRQPRKKTTCNSIWLKLRWLLSKCLC